MEDVEGGLLSVHLLWVLCNEKVVLFDLRIYC